jgi:hypothetical protein
VSANPTILRKKEYVRSGFQLPAKKSFRVRPQPGSYKGKYEGSLLGITGVLFVAAFVGLTVFLVLRYLL